MMPTTDTVSSQPTVPTARDRFDAPLSLARKQTDVTPVLHQQIEGWVKRTGHFRRLVQDGSVYIKGTVYVRDREDLAILASGKKGPTYSSQRHCPATPGRVAQFKTFTGAEVQDLYGRGSA